jgi:hypothetical protein
VVRSHLRRLRVRGRARSAVNGAPPVARSGSEDAAHATPPWDYTTPAGRLGADRSDHYWHSLLVSTRPPRRDAEAPGVMGYIHPALRAKNERSDQRFMLAPRANRFNRHSTLRARYNQIEADQSGSSPRSRRLLHTGRRRDGRYRGT